MKVTHDGARIAGDHVSENRGNKKAGSADGTHGAKFDKVLSDKASAAGSTDKPSRSEAVREPAKVRGVESLRVSEETSKMKFVSDVVKATPDVRADRVAELKAKIDSGTYDVSASDLADRMIDSGFADRLLKS